MTAWHLSDEVLARYVENDLPPARAMSAEAHLLACAACRSALEPAVDPARLERIWAELVHEVDAPWVPRAVGLLRRLGVPDHTVRLMTAAQAMRPSWWTGVAAALALAALAGQSGERGVAMFLVLAPVLPVAGIALAYGPHADPTHELATAAPYSSFRLVLLRSAAVLSVTVVLSAGAALLLPGGPWFGVAWLLPALALSTLTLAMSTWFDVAWSALGLGVLWLTVASSGLVLGHDPLLVFRSGAQLVFLAVVVGGGVLVVARRNAFSTLGGYA